MSEYSDRQRAARQAEREARRNRSNGDGYGGPQIERRGTFGGDGVYNGPQISGRSGRSGGGGDSFGDNPLGFLANGYNEYFAQPMGDFNRANRDLIRSQTGVLSAQRRYGREQEYIFRDQSGLSAREVNMIQRNQYLSNNPEAAGYLAMGRTGALNGTYTLNGQPVPGGYAPYNPDQPNYDAYGVVPPVIPPAAPAGVAPSATGTDIVPPVTGATPPAPGVTPPVTPAGATPATGATPPVTGAPAPATPTTGATPQAGATGESPTLTAASGGQTRVYGVRAQRAPRANEIPKIAQNQVEALQDLLIAANESVGTMGSDGKYGPNTHAALLRVAGRLTPPITDLTTIDFTNPQDPETVRFMAALQPQRAPASPAPATPQPTPEQTAEAQRAAAEAQRQAAEARARAAEEARIPEAIRNTPFDPRNLARMSQQERYDLARTALAGIDELRSPDSRPNLERMHDKMDESVRWSNEHLGTRIPRPAPSDPLSVDAMVALGLRAANEGRLSNDRNQIVTLPENMTQAQMNAAAVQYIRALDRSVDREDPSRAIRRFEERDMGRSGIEVDGLADPQMLAALRQAVAIRNGLVDPSAIRIAATSPQVTPVPTAETQATVPPLPGVTGGAESRGPQGGAPVAPTGQPPVVAASRTP